MFLVDTNILLHAVNSDSPSHEADRTSLESFINGPEQWCLTWGIIYEFLRVATHPRVFRKPLTLQEAYGFIAPALQEENCVILPETGEHQNILEQSRNETHRLCGNLLHDFHIAVIMREHGVEEIVTRDQDFKAFPWVRIRGIEQANSRNVTR